MAQLTTDLDSIELKITPEIEAGSTRFTCPTAIRRLDSLSR